VFRGAGRTQESTKSGREKSPSLTPFPHIWLFAMHLSSPCRALSVC
jgi:hypothetical protein